MVSTELDSPQEVVSPERDERADRIHLGEVDVRSERILQLVLTM